MSEVQKADLWKEYEGKLFSWTMEFVEADSGIFGKGFVVQWKCQNSASLILDVFMRYPESAREVVRQFRKGHLYKIQGRLTRTSTLFGLTAEPH